MSNRASLNLTTKLAAALLQLRGPDGEPLIPYEHSKIMTAAEIVSLFQFDHGILHSTEPINEPWNLTPRLIPEHREKSKNDTKIAAKLKRLRGETCNGPRKKIAQRQNAWPAKGTRKIKSRPFPEPRP